MDWKDVAGKIAKAAPVLGTLLAPVTGGASIAAGGIISMVGSLFGLTPEETTPDRINQLIEQDPEVLVKFKEFEMKHKERLEELLIEKEKVKIEEQKIYLQDTQSARQRQVDSEKVTGKKDTNLYALAWVYIGGYFITMISMTVLAFTNTVPLSMPDYMIFLLGNLFGTLTTGVIAIIQYFFGSSKGSADKTVTMATQFKEALNSKSKINVPM